MLTPKDVEHLFGQSERLNSQSEQRTAKTSRPALESEALHGLAGDLVKAIDPYTEADPVAVLATILLMFGNVVGRNPYFRVEYTNHYLNLFIALVGASSKGRKGVSKSTPRYIFIGVDESWSKDRSKSGLSSGEGLIYHVRDQRIESQPIKEKGRVIDYQDVIVDHGVSDKRLLVSEEELSQALKVMGREGNTLSATIRQAWDSGNLQTLTKNNPTRATDAHISILAHITRDELLRHLNETEKANGFANRFIWLFVDRSKFIPTPQGVPQDKLEPLIERLRDSICFARKVTEMRRDRKAEELWIGIYPELSGAKPGMLGSIVSRAEAQTMRLACIYALLDKSSEVRTEHLKAALALWDYAEASAFSIFGDNMGDPVADKILTALKQSGGLSETEIRDLFGRHNSHGIDRALSFLYQGGQVTTATITTGGRPTTVWRLCDKSDRSDQRRAYVA